MRSYRGSLLDNQVKSFSLHNMQHGVPPQTNRRRATAATPELNRKLRAENNTLRTQNADLARELASGGALCTFSLYEYLRGNIGEKPKVRLQSLLHFPPSTSTIPFLIMSAPTTFPRRLCNTCNKSFAERCEGEAEKIREGKHGSSAEIQPAGVRPQGTRNPSPRDSDGCEPRHPGYVHLLRQRQVCNENRVAAVRFSLISCATERGVNTFCEIAHSNILWGAGR